MAQVRPWSTGPRSALPSRVRGAPGAADGFCSRRGRPLSARPLETSRFEVDGIRMAHVFSEDGLAVSVTYAVADPKLRVVGFRLAR